MTRRHALVVCCVLLTSVVALTAQIVPQRGFRTAPLGKDTLCFRYRFVAGDSLLYKAEARDSITFGKDELIVKEREEWIGVICDSVDAQGRFHLRQQVLSSTERSMVRPSGDTAWRESSHWRGRTAYLVIDSLGMRHRTWVDDDTRAALTLGGAFQPLLLVVLGRSCGRQNESWTVDDTTLYVENGVPEPAVIRKALVRVLDKADTLGMRFHQLQYTQTGIGRMVMPANASTGGLMLDAITNAFGKLSLDMERLIPFHLFATSENKITIASGGSTKEGKHLTSMNYHLVRVISRDPARQYFAAP